MLIKQNFWTVLASIVGALAIALFVSSHQMRPVSNSTRQSVYERVISSGVLRCGYFAEAPFTIIDPNTGEKTGIAVELAEKIAKGLGVKLEWVSAENFNALTEDLNNGRYDAICASTYNLPRAGRIDYTIPYAYAPIYAYAQHNVNIFDHKLPQLDWTKVSVSGRDGEGASIVARQKIPQAKFIMLPEITPLPDMINAVAENKADMVFVSPLVFKDYEIHNPGKLKKVQTDEPFHVFNVSFGLKPNEAGFKNVLDIMLRNMMSDGELQDLYRKYDPDHLLLQPQYLYRSASQASN